jgi:hypothetical protein
MSKRSQLALRRLLEAALVVGTVATGYAAIRGQVSATTLGAIVPVLIAVSVSLDYLNLNRGRRGRCVPRFVKKAP